MPKYILGKDFHLHVGKKILIPHPQHKTLPIEVIIVGVKNKQVTLESVDGVRKADNYSKDKNKYLIVE